MQPQTHTFKRDYGLQARMAFTLALLGGIYAALVAVLLAAGAGLVVTIGVMSLMLVAQFFLSARLGLRAMGARVVSASEAPELHEMIDRLSAAAGIPKPQVAIADNPAPNAFAMGRSRRHAVVCATTGIMGRLSPQELEAVMAHEIGHVKSRDMLVMTVASFFSSIAMMVMQFSLFFGGGEEDEGPSGVVIAFVSFVIYAVSFVLMMALSRYREFAADRTAAALTGTPIALGSALRKISDGMETVNPRELRTAGEMNAFFIVPAGFRGALSALMSTHPPMDQRIARLESYARDMAGS